MYVRVCNAITCKRVKQALCDGKRSVRELRVHFGFQFCCGKCNSHLRSMINEHQQAGTSLTAGERHGCA